MRATSLRAYYTSPEEILLPPTEYDRRFIEYEGSLWSLTLFGGAVERQREVMVEQKRATVAYFEQGFSQIPLHEVGRLPGDGPAP